MVAVGCLCEIFVFYLQVRQSLEALSSLLVVADVQASNAEKYSTKATEERSKES